MKNLRLLLATVAALCGPGRGYAMNLGLRTAVWNHSAHVAAPVVSPTDGSEFFSETCEVSISCATEGATIYYGVNVAPRERPGNVYSGPFTISDTATIYAYAKKGGITSGAPVTATITKRTLALGEALCDGEGAVAATTGGDSDWTPVALNGRDARSPSEGGDGVSTLAAQSGMIGDAAVYGEWNETWLETSVTNTGTAIFWWKVLCEEDGTPDDTWDHAEFSTNGIVVAHADGDYGWRQVSVTFTDAGTHTLRWTFRKDDYNDAEFADHVWVSGFSWTPSSVPDVPVVPSVPDDPGAVVTGDATIGYTVKPSAASGAVEVTIPDGVDAAKVTVEVAPTVESVKAHGAAIKIVKGGHDITELLDIPASGGTRFVSSATVKEAIVKEAIDKTSGAEIDLNASDPSIKTAPTRPGLTYTFSEGTTLEGMTQKAEKQGDGEPWTPTISVKGGASGFYSIGVGK